jgi:t-SNARE complex subunit (syntaxin)
MYTLQDMNDVIKVHFIDVTRIVGQVIAPRMESNYLEMHNDRNILNILNTYRNVFLLLCLCILIVCLCIIIVPPGTLRLP